MVEITAPWYMCCDETLRQLVEGVAYRYQKPNLVHAHSR